MPRTRFERTAPVPFSVVCFRARGTDELNAQLLERINASGEMFLSHTRLDGRYTLRLAIGNLRTTERHIARAWQLIQQLAAELEAPSSAADFLSVPREIPRFTQQYCGSDRLCA